MSKPVIHSIVLIITIAIAFLFPKTNLAQYDLQISAVLFIIMFFSRRLINQAGRLLESVIFTLVILLIVGTTGNTSSPFFFLIYFLLFALALLMEPIIAITVSFTLMIGFMFSISPNQEVGTLIPVFSLAFLTPFALLLGQEYVRIKNDELRIKNLEGKINQKQEDTFLFLSLMLKNHLKNIKSAIESFMGDHELHEIKRNTEKMERLIEKFENN